MFKKWKELQKKSNKGFSLVELIVVICIMAVLTGIIAAAFIQYVGKSKDTADKTNVDEIRKTVLTVLADPTLGTVDEGKYVITGDGKKEYNKVGDSFYNLLEAALGTNEDGKPKYPVLNDTSKFIVITISGDASNGYNATVELSDTNPNAGDAETE